MPRPSPTRALIAVATAPDAWRGVVHEFDGYPHGLGNALLRRVEAEGGDVGAVVRAWIEAAPGGWESAERGARRTLPEGEAPVVTSTDALPAGVAWVYVLSPEAGALRVMRVRDGALELHAAVDCSREARRGHTPLWFTRPQEAWERAEPAAGWAGESPEHEALRLGVDRALSAHFRLAGTSLPQARALLAAVLKRSLVGERDWRERERVLRVPCEPSKHGPLRAVEVAGATLVYPERASLRRTMWWDTEGRLLHVQRPLEAAQAVPESAQLGASGMASAVEVLARSVLAQGGPAPEVYCDAETGQLFRLYEVVEAVENPVVQVDVERARATDPASELGDTFGVQIEVDWLSPLLDWLREAQQG